MPHLRMVSSCRRPLWRFLGTFIRVLSRELRHSVPDLAPHRRIGLLGQALQQFGADGLSLGVGKGQKQVGGLA